MKRALSAFALGLVTVVQADETADAKKAIQAQMDAFCNAAKLRDGTKMERALRTAFAENATVTPYKSKPIKLDGWILNQKSQLAMLDKIDSISLKITSLKINGARGTLRSSFKMVGYLQPASGTARVKLESSGVSEDSIAKVKGAWKITSSKAMTGSVLLNGKPAK